MTLLLPKAEPLSKPEYLDWLRGRPCLVTNRPGPCDPHHLKLGWFAKGIKPPDDWAVPLLHEQHRHLHDIGERTFWLLHLNKDRMLLADVMRGYARDLYRRWEGRP